MIQCAWSQELSPDVFMMTYSVVPALSAQNPTCYIIVPRLFDFALASLVPWILACRRSFCLGYHGLSYLFMALQ